MYVSLRQFLKNLTRKNGPTQEEMLENVSHHRRTSIVHFLSVPFASNLFSLVRLVSEYGWRIVEYGAIKCYRAYALPLLTEKEARRTSDSASQPSILCNRIEGAKRSRTSE